MSGLKERLLRMKKADQSAEQKRELSVRDEWESIEAGMEHTEWGAFVLRRRVYEANHKHGRYRLDELFGQAGYLSLLQQTQAIRDHEQLLFFDTETTGLGIGAGNVPFMIGIGYYRGNDFIVEQMFIRNPGEELAMLHYLQAKLERHTHLVSYNGKSFDWPIVKGRYILNRLQLEADRLVQLDFLYPSRSLWKHTMPSCRLGRVEEERLGVVRLDDVPGSLAPTLYFQYLAERDPLIVKGVFAHNELDILTLAALSIHLANALQGKLNAADMSCEELFRLGLWLDKLGRHRYADDILQQLTSREPEEAADYWLPLAKLYKKRGEAGRSAALWRRYVAERGNRATASIEPFIELAMYYEHREKDYRQALYYAEQGLNKAWKRQTLKRIGSREQQERHAKELEEIQKRIERLKKRSAGAERKPVRRKPEWVMDELFPL